eukprot:2739692-Prymnesium_polylepis.1
MVQRRPRDLGQPLEAVVVVRVAHAREKLKQQRGRAPARTRRRAAALVRVGQCESRPHRCGCAHLSVGQRGSVWVSAARWCGGGAVGGGALVGRVAVRARPHARSRRAASSTSWSVLSRLE